jgi:hypothetical protein
MPDDPRVVALLKALLALIVASAAKLTRTETGTILGLTRGQVAGICDRNGIAPWPTFRAKERRGRTCQFPVGEPGVHGFRVCGEKCAPGHQFLCVVHRNTKWPPAA